MRGRLRSLVRAGVALSRFSLSAIDLLRSAMLSHALREGFDSMLFIDADIGFDPADALRLLARPEPVVAGIYVHNKGAISRELLRRVSRRSFSAPRHRASIRCFMCRQASCESALRFSAA